MQMGVHLLRLVFLTCVNVRMLLHIRLLVEPLAAVLAGVRPRVRVDEEVRGEGGGALEGFAAHLALKAFFLFKYTELKSDCIVLHMENILPDRVVPESGRSCVAPD